MKLTKKPAEILCPTYFEQDVWEGFVKYLNSDNHTSRAKAGAEHN